MEGAAGESSKCFFPLSTQYDQPVSAAENIANRNVEQGMFPRGTKRKHRLVASYDHSKAEWLASHTPLISLAAR